MSYYFFFADSDETNQGPPIGGEFVIHDYGVYIRPRNGSVLLLNTAKIRHGTMKNTGFTQMGSSMVTKGSVLKQCKKHMTKLQKISDAITSLKSRAEFDALIGDDTFRAKKKKLMTQ